MCPVWTEAELGFAPGEAVVGFGVAENDAPDLAGGEVLAALGVVEVFGGGFVPEAVAALVVDEGVDAVDDPVFPGMVAADEGVGPGGGLEFQPSAAGDGPGAACETGVAVSRIPRSAFDSAGIESRRRDAESGGGLWGLPSHAGGSESCDKGPRWAMSAKLWDFGGMSLFQSRPGSGAE